jgi:hypothetical protein
MPRPHQEYSIFPDKSLDLVNFMVGKSKVLGKVNRIKPELGNAPILFHMDMDGLTAIRAEEHEAVRAHSENRWKQQRTDQSTPATPE